MKYVAYGAADGDSRIPSSLATVQVGEGVEYRIRLDVDRLRKATGSRPDQKAPVIVSLALHTLEEEDDGKFASVMDKNSIASNTFLIPLSRQ